MKLTTTPQEFTSASVALLRASPSTTKVTTTYHAAAPGKGTLTLKTYDPVSGAVIKFRTAKIADVGRLVAGLQRLAREQTGAPVPVETTDTAMTDAPPAPAAAETEIAAATPAAATSAAATTTTGAKGKKKKGKK